MKTVAIIIVILLVLAVAGIILLNKRAGQKGTTTPPTTIVQERNDTMKITSSVFGHNQPIPTKYTCDGQNVNPPLAFSDIPEAAKSLVLINDDPDAPAGTWVHWTVWNISPQTTGIEEDSVPAGSVESVTSFGKPGYGGPCPPSGTHRYFFKLYALDTTLDVDSSTTKQDLEKAMEDHILAQAELIGLYSRNE